MALRMSPPGREGESLTEPRSRQMAAAMTCLAMPGTILGASPIKPRSGDAAPSAMHGGLER